MQEIVKAVRDLNRAFNHNAEPIFVNTQTGEIDARNAPTFQKYPLADNLVLNWMTGNYGYVHPDYPNYLFFAVDLIGDPEILACCLPPLFFSCVLCKSETEVSGTNLARHEFIHSLQLRLNPNISHGLAEGVADVFEIMDLVF